MHSHHHQTETDHVAFWENHYGQSERVWSGNVNKVLADTVAGLPVGRSLDFGCGEGADVLWLASKGWKASGVDISATAVTRAQADAAKHDFSEQQARFITADLTTWTTDEQFDLVTLSFFQAPFEFPRAKTLQSAASLVAPGGHLLAVSHAAAPSWTTNEQMAQHSFPSPNPSWLHWIWTQSSGIFFEQKSPNAPSPTRMVTRRRFRTPWCSCSDEPKALFPKKD